MGSKSKILIPAGIGDAYWILVKLPAFLLREGIQESEITIWGSSDNWKGHLRSVRFLEMVPFIKVGSPEFIEIKPSDLYTIYENSFLRPGRTIVSNPTAGYDYFICYNGNINSGRYLEEVDTDLECDWYPNLLISSEQEQFKDDCLKKLNKYVIFYWPFSSYYERQLNNFSSEKITESIQTFLSRSGLTPVFIGAFWDTRYNDILLNLMNSIPGMYDLTGKTTLDQAFGLIKGAELVVGYHSGITNMAVVFKKKTLLLWDENQFPPSLPLAVAPPDTRGTTYRPLFSNYLTVDRFVGTMMELYEQK